MEETDINQRGEGTEATRKVELTDLSPLNIIRTETVISRLPIHNLAKTGRVNIQIVRKTSKGEIDLKWEVSYSDRYGQPRQLAYKLDTLVINRRIDEEGRPLPKMIRIGSLRDIADDLDLGGDTNLVRKALRQNASAFITAKFNYTSNDGTERHLEADFTRYGVIFTGEKLPDGRKADAVYIILNEPYREVVNNSPVRPLDYDYLKILPPIAQRFYEIVSRKIFAALKHGHENARLSYAEFCTYSAQQRQLDYTHFKKQMYKVHRPHLKSAYIAKITYELTTDTEGKPDWMMLYTPGTKARAEFEVFNGASRAKRAPRERRLHTPRRANTKTISETDNDNRAGKAEGTQLLLTSIPSSTTEPSELLVDPQLLNALTERGLMNGAKLLASLSGERLAGVPDYIEYWDQIPAEKKGTGLLYTLINNNDPLPRSFESSRQRGAKKAAVERQEHLARAKQSLELAYEQYERDALDRYIEAEFPKEEYERLYREQRQQMSKQGSFFENRSGPMFEEMIRGSVRSEIRKAMNVNSFDDFCRREGPKILADYGIDPAELGIVTTPGVAEPGQTPEQK